MNYRLQPRAAEENQAGALPVHGFVLAGGKSSRMGRDKALLKVSGEPMLKIAVDKLRTFCASVSIVGDREDLLAFGRVVRGERKNSGPAAGIEAALKSSRQPWAMFIPVDVPLVPAELLRQWAQQTLNVGQRGPSGSYLTVELQAHPTFCILSRQCLAAWRDALNHGERRLELLLARARVPGRYGAAPVDAAQYAPDATPHQMRRWFSNINTPEDLEGAESLLQVKG